MHSDAGEQDSIVNTNFSRRSF